MAAKISALVRAGVGEMTTREPLWPAAARLREAYDKLELAKKFAPQNQYRYAQYPGLCVTSQRVPTLAVAANAYGRDFVKGWLMGQIEDLNRGCGASSKMEADEVEMVADAIATTYSHLRLTDIMLFMVKFKGGAYGRFYGRNDSLVITTALADYEVYRRAEAGREMARQAKAAAERRARGEYTLEEFRRDWRWKELTDEERAAYEAHPDEMIKVDVTPASPEWVEAMFKRMKEQRRKQKEQEQKTEKQ